MNLSKMKVGTRLLLGFGLVVALVVISSVLSVKELGDVQDNVEEIVTDNNVRLQHDQELGDALDAITRSMRSIALLDNDPAAQQEEEARLEQERQNYAAKWRVLTQMPPADEKDKDIRERILKAYEACKTADDQFLDLVRAKKLAEATNQLMKVADPCLRKAQAVITEGVKLQEEENRKEYEASEASEKYARNLTITIDSLIVLAAIALGWLITRSITRQLGGEPGEAAEVAHRVAEGELRMKVTLRPGDTTSMMAQMHLMTEDLTKVVVQVKASATSVASAAEQIAAGNSDLSGRTEEQAASLEETASSIEELTATVRQNAENARQANQLSQNASTVAVRGGEVVAQVVSTMQGISESSRKISDIIAVIDGIAFQTNILALNAAVEAARAGEQGKGFAVVASEVRALAGRSAEAAKEIKGLIVDSVQRVSAGTEQVEKAGVTMQEVVTAIRRVTDIMGEISAATDEQAGGIEQINRAITQMDLVTQQNAALVEESAAAATSLETQAMNLVDVISVFKIHEDVQLSSALQARSVIRQAAHDVQHGIPKALGLNNKPVSKPAVPA